MTVAKEITWPETIAYRITSALRFSGIIDEDNYLTEQEARNEIIPIIRRWCIPIEHIDEWQARAENAEKRITELEAQLAAQAWPRQTEPVPSGELVEAHVLLRIFRYNNRYAPGDYDVDELEIINWRFPAPTHPAH